MARPPLPPGPTARPDRPLPADVGRRALAHIETLVSFGARHSGTSGWERAIDHIADSLAEMGLQPQRDAWVDADEGLRFVNVSALIPGGRPDRIVLGCHHDTKITTGHDDPLHNFEFVGANDSASGVALLLELARELARTPPARCSVEVVFFDGEESIPFDWDPERALFGSRRYVRRYRAARRSEPSTPPIRAMVLLDMVGARDLTIDDETFSTPALKSIIGDAARHLGHERHFFADSIEVRDDHKPFLDAGIPAVDLIDIADNPQWHTPDDTLDHVSARSLQIVGEVVWQALPEIARRYVPAGD